MIKIFSSSTLFICQYRFFINLAYLYKLFSKPNVWSTICNSYNSNYTHHSSKCRPNCTDISQPENSSFPSYQLFEILKLKFFTTSRIPVKCLDFIDMFFSRVYQKLQLKSKKKHTQISITEVKATTLTSKFQKTGICRSINDHYSHHPKIVNVHIWNKKIRCKPVSKWNSTL